MISQIRHPNLVMLLGVCVESSPMLMILEYLPAGALDEWLTGSGVLASEASLIRVLYQVALGMKALRRSGCVHRDLAARNVLIGEDLVAKVADFGLSREISSSGTSATGDDGRNGGSDYYYQHVTDRPLPVRWTAPEVLHQARWTFETDVYSFAVLVYEVFR